MKIEVPLISPVSRKYYNYALETENRMYYRTVDIRICMERICDEIIIRFVSESEQKRWKKYKLHKKLTLAKQFMDETIVDKIIDAKMICNEGVHQGEEGEYTEVDIEKSIEYVREFSLELFVSYFKLNGFNIETKPRILTVFSTLPPIYRSVILRKYYKFDNSFIVIDKLSKAYTKARMDKEAKKFLEECYNKKELTFEQYTLLINDVELLSSNIDKLPIANDLNMAKDNFNNLMEIIPEEERDGFIYLVSIILNGYKS